MINLSSKSLPWNRFNNFITPDIDRFTVLKNILEETGLKYKVITISGNRHFFISPPQGEAPKSTNGIIHEPKKKQTILVAHYDRVSGSQGANDNSTAVFLLIETALKLLKNNIQNWYIIFTDKEELTSGEGIKNQGAYTLAAGLISAGLEHARVYNFDACGRGDTLIISTSAEHLVKNENSERINKFRTSIKDLQEYALEKAKHLGIGKVMLAPTPFSDDAGFLHAGLAAQTITVLPSNESSKLISMLRRDPAFAHVLVNQKSRNAGSQLLIPETWQILNTAKDSVSRLTPENFYIVLRFAESLCKG